MTDELVAYLLDDLCAERRDEVERRLATDAVWQQEFQRLKECFAATGDPTRCVVEPPKDLVKRTCCYVEHAAEGRGCSATAAAFAATPLSLGGSSSWSFADVTVGGGVLLVLGMLMLPALRESRDATRRMVCQDNLRTLGTGLFEFQRNHGGWLPTMAPDAPAGLYAIALADDVGFDRRELAHLLVCPESPLAEKISSGEEKIIIPTYDELSRMFGEERARIIQNLGGAYAYRVGYFDKQGVYHQVKYSGEEGDPMLSDAPRLSSLGIRSANHDGCGQNVVDQGISVTYRANCDLATSLDPIFVNMRGEHAAGCDASDIVMLRGERQPNGAASIHLFRDAVMRAGAR